MTKATKPHTTRDQALGNLLRAAEALTDGSCGNGSSLYVSQEHLHKLMDAILEVRLT